MKKVGRNEPCPCGSGKKYKKCHGDLAQQDRMSAVMADLSFVRARHEAREVQRSNQQGLGRPIISTKTDSGHQFVAVNNRLFQSTKWRTFHDFLGEYLTHVLGPEWGNAEFQKPQDQRHPILVWYHMLCHQQRAILQEPGQVSSSRMTGAVAAYMHLAYDLYALDHNAELQAKLIARLRNHDNFFGARYEVKVAAILVRAGFSLKFVNEDDRNSSHCEFTATHPRSGKQFSVEAKRSESKRRFNRQIVRALEKAADHTRIVFVDLNMPDSSKSEELPDFFKRAFNLLRRFEALDPMAQRLPPAYMFITNAPFEHHLDSVDFRVLAMGDGFHIDEFKLDHEFPSLRAAIDGRRAHAEMHDLLNSMKAHSDIPVTFDGESPELAFGAAEAWLKVGSRYVVPGPDGTDIEGVLASATVIEKDMVAVCAINAPDGQGMIFHAALSDAELAAWKRHPDTFFGEVSRNRTANTVLDLYDIFMESQIGTPKAKLLEFLANAPDMVHLATLDQPELASVYCERIATSVFSRMGPAPEPVLRSRLRPRPGGPRSPAG